MEYFTGRADGNKARVKTEKQIGDARRAAGLIKIAQTVLYGFSGTDFGRFIK